MIYAGLDMAMRKAIYRRDGFRCALCDSTDGLQLHHVIWRGRGGSDDPANVITLCWRCHAAAHGTRIWDEISAEDIYQASIEYLADFYAEEAADFCGL